MVPGTVVNPEEDNNNHGTSGTGTSVKNNI